ncbi:MAG: hypothetical protein ACI3XN_02320, partial [Eubacteriales bacterium]
SAYTFTWEGRQMQTATKGNTTWTYTYNADGLRTGEPSPLPSIYGKHCLFLQVTESGFYWILPSTKRAPFSALLFLTVTYG